MVGSGRMCVSLASISLRDLMGSSILLAPSLPQAREATVPFLYSLSALVIALPEF